MNLFTSNKNCDGLKRKKKRFVDILGNTTVHFVFAKCIPDFFKVSFGPECLKNRQFLFTMPRLNNNTLQKVIS